MRLITILRKQKEMRQSDIARAAKTSRATISALERGAVATDATRHGTVKALENLFNMPIDKLLAEIKVVEERVV